MDNKMNTAPGYGRGRGRGVCWSGNDHTVSRGVQRNNNNFVGHGVWRNHTNDNTFNWPVGHFAPEWIQRFGYNAYNQGQHPFAVPMFNGEMKVPPFFKSGIPTNNSTIGRNFRRGNLSWADIRQQSQCNGLDESMSDANTSPVDKPQNFPFRDSRHMDGPWGGRGRGILEKVSSDDESSCHSNENKIWGGRGRGSILCAPKQRYEKYNFGGESRIARGQNRSHRGHFRGEHGKNENTFVTNRREPMSASVRVPRPMPKPIPMPMPMAFPLFSVLDKLDLNFSCGKQEEKQKKEPQQQQQQQQRKNGRKGRKRGSLSNKGCDKPTNNFGNSSSAQNSTSCEDHKSNKGTVTKETVTKEDGVLPNTKRLVVINEPGQSSAPIQKKQDNPNNSCYPSHPSISFENHKTKEGTETNEVGVLPITKRLVVINEPREVSGEIQKKQHNSSKSCDAKDTGSLKEQEVNKVNDTYSDVKQNIAEKQTETYETECEYDNKSCKLSEDNTAVKEIAVTNSINKPLSQIIHSYTDNSKCEKNNDQT